MVRVATKMQVFLFEPFYAHSNVFYLPLLFLLYSSLLRSWLLCPTLSIVINGILVTCTWESLVALFPVFPVQRWGADHWCGGWSTSVLTLPGFLCSTFPQVLSIIFFLIHLTWSFSGFWGHIRAWNFIYLYLYTYIHRHTHCVCVCIYIYTHI